MREPTPGLQGKQSECFAVTVGSSRASVLIGPVSRNANLNGVTMQTSSTSKWPTLATLGIDEALATLSEKYRVVFVLRDIEELSTREPADILGISVEAVKVRLLRARLMLRERLTRLFGDESTRIAPHDH